MATMIRKSVHQFDSQYFNDIPEESGIISFFSANTLLYVTEAINIKQQLLRLISQKSSDLTINELFEKSDYVQMEETSSAVEALIQIKAILETEKPEFNQSIHKWKDYVYLAINPAEFPFVKISEFTDADWFYLGPFRNRFFINDVMEIMSKLLKLPYCEEKQGPCEKLDNDTCRGWCTMINSNIDAEKENPQLAKLDALLKEAFVHPDNGLLEMLLKEKSKYEDDLQFAKADLLTAHIELLDKYKKWLIFLYKIKNFNFDMDNVSVRNGQIVKYKSGMQKISCPIVNIPYRPNEILALNKNLVDEGWILYQESM